LAGPRDFQRLESIPWQRGEVVNRRCRIKLVQLHLRLARDTIESLDALSASEITSPLVTVAQYHDQLQSSARYALRQT